MKILVTGAAGFIGFHFIKQLLAEDNYVVGIDNMNNYYNVDLKKIRLSELEKCKNSENFTFLNEDIANRKATEAIFAKYKFDVVVNLAAQAGVRYSITDPYAYVDSNLVGFVNVLEGCRNYKIKHFLYASSSSVYGMNVKQPFSVNDRVDHPISLYAATKKSNELIAHSYSHLYNIPTTGLRFFTVYGPFGRPDMAYYKFTKAIMNGEQIDVFNNGMMKRDFTYIDDIVKGMLRLIPKIPTKSSSEFSNAKAPYKIFNIGNNNPITLDRFIKSIEGALGVSAIKNLLPMQPGDVPITYADVDDLEDAINFKPQYQIEDGIEKFVDWYTNSPIK